MSGVTNIATHEVALADFDKVTAINLRGTLITSQAVLPDMLELITAHPPRRNSKPDIFEQTA